MESEGEQLVGDADATAELKREFPHGEMDIVIQNPPFLTSSADTNSKEPKRVFESEGRSEAEQKAMLKELALKESRISHGKVAYSYFVELADKKLRNGGRMGIILPATVLTSAKPGVEHYYQIEEVSFGGKPETLMTRRLRGPVSPAHRALTTFGEVKQAK